MPQPFENAVITNAGARLLTRAQAGEASIEFTRIAVGDGAYSAEEKALDAMQDRTALKSLKNSYPLSGVEIINDHCVKITALITNRDPAGGQALVTTGYHINEMGLFAREKDADGDTEVLYSVTVTTGENGDFMPPYNGYNPAQITQEYYATVSNAAEVTIRIVDAGAALLVEDAEREFRRIDGEIDKLKQGTADVMTGATETKNGLEGLAPAPAAGKADRYLRSDGTWVSSGEQTLEFTAAAERTEIISGEKRSSILGKIAKWFSDLKTVAFTGSYKDLTGAPASLPANGGNADSVGGKNPAELQNYNNLSNKPTALKNPNALTFTGAVSSTYDGSAAKTVNIPSAPAAMAGATASAAGRSGLAPAPAAGAANRYLRSDGTWQVPPNTTYGAATQTTDGLMSAADKRKMLELDIHYVDRLSPKSVTRNSVGFYIVPFNGLSASFMHMGGAYFCIAFGGALDTSADKHKCKATCIAIASDGVVFILTGNAGDRKSVV